MSFSTFFTPHSSVVQNITTGRSTMVTTTSDHGLSTGYLVKLFFPPGDDFGINQNLLNQSLLAIVLNPTTVLLAVDTSGSDPFVPSLRQKVQMISVGAYFGDIPPLNIESEKNNGNITPMYGWTNTTFPWVNSNSLVRH